MGNPDENLILDTPLAGIKVKDEKHFARLLAAARHTARKTQADVAAGLGVTRGTVAFREQNQRQVTVKDAVPHLAELGYALAIVPLDD